LVVKTNPDVHVKLYVKTNLGIDTNLDPPTNHKINPDKWTLFFDVSKSNEGAHVWCILKYTKGKMVLISCRLEFQCTIKTIEYKSLIQGLRNKVDLKVNFIKVFGDSEIVIRQVQNNIYCISNNLKHYQQEVWDLIKIFDAFNISPIPCSLNYDAYLLSNVATKLIPSEGIMPYTFFVELLYMPSTPNKIMNCRVFKYDQHIIIFFHIKYAFKDSTVDEIQHDQDLNSHMKVFLVKVANEKIAWVNTIPTIVVRLEKLYDL